MDYDIAEIRTIIDELIRMGLVKENWYPGESEPRYITTVEYNKNPEKYEEGNDGV